MEDNTGSKRKTTSSISPNYITILHLQERWIKEKQRKLKEEEEEEERRRKHQAEEKQRIEEDLKKAEVKGKQEDLDENRLNRSNRKKHWGRYSKQNESFDGEEARWAEKEETAAIRSERGKGAAPIDEGTALRDDGLPEKERGFRRKRYNSKKKKKKKKNQEVAAVKEDVVDECGSSLPPVYTVTENNTRVKDHRKKSEKAMGKRSVEHREKAVIDDATAIERQFEDLAINRGEERGETKNFKAQTRSSHRNRPNQRRDLSLPRVRMPTETATMVWVKKKGQNERADHGSGSGVKPLNA